MRYWIVAVLILGACSCEETRQRGRLTWLRQQGYSNPEEIVGSQQLCGENDEIVPVRVAVTCNGTPQSLLLCCRDSGLSGVCEGLWDHSEGKFQEAPKCDVLTSASEQVVGKTTGRAQYVDDPTNLPIYPCSEAQPEECWVLPGGVKSVLRYSVPTCQGDPLFYSDCYKERPQQ